MNALQNLPGVGVGGPGVIGIGPRPPGAPMSVMEQIQMGQHTMQGVAGGQQAGKFSSCLLIRKTLWLNNLGLFSRKYNRIDIWCDIYSSRGCRADADETAATTAAVHAVPAAASAAECHAAAVTTDKASANTPAESANAASESTTAASPDSAATTEPGNGEGKD